MKSWVLLSALLIGGGGLVYYTQFYHPSAASSPEAQTKDISQGAPLVEVIVPANLSETATLGKIGYDAKCAACHGENGAGKEGFGPPLVHKIYEPSHHTDEAIMMAPVMGVQAHHWNFGNMPPVEGVTREDMVYITEYIREMQRANGIN